MMKPTEYGMTVLTCVIDPWVTCTGQLVSAGQKTLAQGVPKL